MVNVFQQPCLQYALDVVFDVRLLFVLGASASGLVRVVCAAREFELHVLVDRWPQVRVRVRVREGVRVGVTVGVREGVRVVVGLGLGLGVSVRVKI